MSGYWKTHSGRARTFEPEKDAGEKTHHRQNETEAEVLNSSEQNLVYHIEIEMPSSKAGSDRALKDLPAFFVGALKRRAVEISKRRMTPEEKIQFDQAKGTEVFNFLAAKAFEALPAGKRCRREDAVNMRWTLTWKVKDDGTRKAKARAVLQGFQDLADMPDSARCWSGLCCWTLVKEGKLRGIVSGHVDDVLFSGSATDPVWVASEKAIKDEFKSDWEEGRFVQCGVLIEQEQDGSHTLSQKHYAESIPAINIRASRKR